MLQDIQWALLCDPDTTVCSAFDDFGGTDNVVSIYYRRLWQFLRDTELTKAEATLSADTAGVYPLPANLITLNRVEVDGYAVQPMDAKQADLWNSAWGTLTTDEIQGYIIEPGESLTLKLVPNRTGRTVKVVYVSASDAATVPANCTEASWAVLPLPYAFSWAVKWGTIADLLSQEGEMNDPVRAKFAEELYQLGVAVAKTMITRRGGA